jgi:DNA-binding XRE family transcriptional regulator
MNESNSGNNTKMTPFGKMMRMERLEAEIPSQAQMAKSLGVSTGKLSEIESGRKVIKGKCVECHPSIEYMIKCQDYFGWKITDKTDDKNEEKIKKTIELFEAGLLSSETIEIDTRYFLEDRRDMLVKILTVLLLMPNRNDPESNMKNGIDIVLDSLQTEIEKCFSDLKELRQPNNLEIKENKD